MALNGVLGCRWRCVDGQFLFYDQRSTPGVAAGPSQGWWDDAGGAERGIREFWICSMGLYMGQHDLPILGPVSSSHKSRFSVCRPLHASSCPGPTGTPKTVLTRHQKAGSFGCLQIGNPGFPCQARRAFDRYEFPSPKNGKAMSGRVIRASGAGILGYTFW